MWANRSSCSVSELHQCLRSWSRQSCPRAGVRGYSRSRKIRKKNREFFALTFLATQNWNALVVDGNHHDHNNATIRNSVCVACIAKHVHWGSRPRTFQEALREGSKANRESSSELLLLYKKSSKLPRRVWGWASSKADENDFLYLRNIVWPSSSTFGRRVGKSWAIRGYCRYILMFRLSYH